MGEFDSGGKGIGSRDSIAKRDTGIETPASLVPRHSGRQDPVAAQRKAVARQIQRSMAAWAGGDVQRKESAEQDNEGESPEKQTASEAEKHEADEGAQGAREEAPALGLKVFRTEQKPPSSTTPPTPPPKTPGGRNLSGHAARDSLKRHGFVEPFADVDAIIDGASRVTTQADGAKVYLQRAGGSRRVYNIVIVGDGNTIVTAMKGLDPVALRALARNYDFDPNP